MTEKRRELKALKLKYRQDKKEIIIKYANDPELKRQKIEKRLQKKAERIEKKRLRKERNDSMPKRYTIGEEIFNSVSHGIGAGLSVAAIVLLVVKAALFAPEGKTGIYVTSFTIFGASLLILYLMSTLYHALTPYDTKNVFAVFDHSSIYILIAGTYTPFCLTAMNPVTGWVMFGVVWGLAVFGVVMYSVFGSKMRLISAITYLPMGLMILFVLNQLAQHIPVISIVFLLSGGALYVIGWPFYLLKKKKWMHSIFHLFVLGGSILHFFSVFFFL